jgi:hypothetical protein
MQLIQTSGNKTFNIIPRTFDVDDIIVELTSESTNTTIDVETIPTTSGDYLQFTVDFGTLTEGDFYILELKKSQEQRLGYRDVIYRDKVFCTDQTVNQISNDYYSINKNEYTVEDSYDNEYIII